MSEPTSRTFALPELIACAERELKMREKVYPRFIAQGKMKPDEAEAECAKMEAIAVILRALNAGAVQPPA